MSCSRGALLLLGHVAVVSGACGKQSSLLGCWWLCAALPSWTNCLLQIAGSLLINPKCENQCGYLLRYCWKISTYSPTAMHVCVTAEAHSVCIYHAQGVLVKESCWSSKHCGMSVLCEQRIAGRAQHHTCVPNVQSTARSKLQRALGHCQLLAGTWGFSCSVASQRRADT